MEVLLLIHIFDDITKKTWMKIFGIFILHCIFSFINYSFLYTNERSAYICEWMEHSVKGVLSYFGIFFAIFVVVWIVQYLIWKVRVSKIKEGIQKNN